MTPDANLNPTPAPGAETLMHIPAASQPSTALILDRSYTLPSSLQDITFDAGRVTVQKYKANKDCVRSKLGNICIEEKGEYYKVTSRHNYRKGKMEDFTLWIFKGVTSL